MTTAKQACRWLATALLGAAIGWFIGSREAEYWRSEAGVWRKTENMSARAAHAWMADYKRCAEGADQ